jgi:hypothetical protein
MVPKVECRKCHKTAEVSSEGELPKDWRYTKLAEELAEYRGKPTCQDCLGTGGPNAFIIVDRTKVYQD